MSPWLDRYQKFRDRLIRGFPLPILVAMVLLMPFVSSCSEAPKGANSNTASGSGQKPDNANAVSQEASGRSESIDAKDPERYSVTMTVSAQDTASDAPAPMLTQQLNLAKLGSDRRWTFVFPAPMGQIVYLEKSGLRYLVLFERKQYVELATDALGFQLGTVLIPNAIAERLKQRRPEKLGLEPVNGRTAIKYRFPAAGESSTPTDLVYVDQETGLALRSELNSAVGGTKSRMIVEIRDVQLNPDRAQFDVPAGMKKVSEQEAKQQIESFASALRTFDDILTGRPSVPAVKVGQSAANKNASRNGR